MLHSTVSEVVRIGKRFTIVIPKSIRTKLNVKEGDVLEIRIEDDKIVLEPRKTNPFKVLERVVGEPYSEKKDEKLAERWLKDACC